jgi:hypothetical protein
MLQFMRVDAAASHGRRSRTNSNCLGTEFGKLLNAWNAKQGGKVLSFRGEH